MEEQYIIQACQQNDRRAQRQLYERYAPKMYGVCRRYIRNETDVEDVLLKGFFKVFSNIQQYKGQGSFEGWIRRIMVNESLMFLRKKKNLSTLSVVELNEQLDKPTQMNPESKIREGEILKLLDKLPAGYRTVFNLYVIEGYGHKEIAELLNVSVNTSKSQLLKARRMLQKMLQNVEFTS